MKVLKNDVFDVLKRNGFKRRRPYERNHPKFVAAFDDKKFHFVEVYKEYYGYSVIVYGGKFQNNVFPTVFDITSKDDLIGYFEKGLKEKL